MEVVVGHQAGLPHGQENAFLHPALKTVVGGGAGTEAGGIQGAPLTAATEHEQNGFHAGAIGGWWFATAEGVGIHPLGDQQGDGFPQVVGNAPLILDVLALHGSTSPSRSCPETTSAAHACCSHWRVIRIGSKLWCALLHRFGTYLSHLVCATAIGGTCRCHPAASPYRTAPRACSAVRRANSHPPRSLCSAGNNERAWALTASPRAGGPAQGPS